MLAKDEPPGPDYPASSTGAIASTSAAPAADIVSSLEEGHVGLKTRPRASSLPPRLEHDHVPLYPPLSRRASTGALPVAVAPLQTPSGLVTPGLAVRAGLLRRIFAGFQGLGGGTRIALLIKLFLVMGQLVAFAVVLGVYKSESCDKPLRAYLIVHIVRSTLSYPLGLYVSLLPPTPASGDSDEETAELRAEREARRVIGSELWDSRIKLASDLMLIFAIVWLCVFQSPVYRGRKDLNVHSVLGNVWLWTSDTCRTDASAFYYSTLVSLIFGYFYLAEVVLIVFAIVFFLPVAVLVLTAMGYGEKKPAVGPLTQSEIDAIPIVLYTPATDAQVADTGEIKEQVKGNGAAIVDRRDEPKPIARPLRRPRFSRLLFSRKSRRADKTATEAMPPTSLPYPLHPLPENLSTCPICLCDFEVPPTDTPAEGQDPVYDLLRLLPCGHCIHKDCIDEWLKTSGRCPVCQESIKPASEKRKGRQVPETDEANVDTV